MDQMLRSIMYLLIVAAGYALIRLVQWLWRWLRRDAGYSLGRAAGATAKSTQKFWNAVKSGYRGEAR